MAKIIVSGMQKRKKLGLPTYCYCNYRLLRATKLASAVSAIQNWGCPFNLEWLSGLDAEKESLAAFAKQLGDWEIEKLNGNSWQRVKRTTKIDLNSTPPISNFLRRIVWSSKEGGNGVEGILIYWFSINEGWLPFIQDGNLAILHLSDDKSPCSYRIRYMINGAEYYIMIDGSKTVRERKRKRTGRTTQDSQSVEQAETATERKLSATEALYKELQASQNAVAHEDVNQASNNLEL